MLGSVIVSLLIGAGQALAVILAVLPLVMPDANVPRFLFHSSIPAIVIQVFGIVLSLILGHPRCPWQLGWRIATLVLSVGLLWTMGWGEGASVLLAIALTLAFVFSSGSGVLSTFAVGISFTASCAAVAHPLLIQTLIPSALIAIWLLTAVRGVLWLMIGIDGHVRDIAVVALVGGTFAPTVMFLGGWLGHDNALLTAGLITQIIGFTAARWVARSLTAGEQCHDRH
jgi:hypothetical protein